MHLCLKKTYKLLIFFFIFTTDNCIVFCQSVGTSSKRIRATLDFRKVKIAPSIYYQGEEFTGVNTGEKNRVISLIHAKVGDFIFSNCHFQDRVELISNRLYTSAMFIWSEFENEFNSAYNKYYCPVDFSSVFNRGTTFSNDSFLRRVDFGAMRQPSQFKQEVSFYGCIFTANISFDKVQFYKTVEFTKVTFKKEATFIDTQLPDTLYLKEMNLDSLQYPIDFTRASVTFLRNRKGANEKCVIFLKKMDVSKVLLSSSLFTLGIDSSYQYDDIIRQYEQIIKKSEEYGFLQNAQDWDIEYMKVKNVHYWGRIFGHLINVVNENWWNFGYNRGRILILWLPLFLMLFFLLNIFLIPLMIKSVYYDDELGKNYTPGQSRDQLIQRLKSNKIFRIKYAFFYSSIIYFNIRLRQECINYQNFFGLLYLYLFFMLGTIHVVFGILGYLLKV